MADTLHSSTCFGFKSAPRRREVFAVGHFFTSLADFDSVKCCTRRALKFIPTPLTSHPLAIAATAAQDAADKTNDDSIGRVVGSGRLRRRT